MFGFDVNFELEDCARGEIPPSVRIWVDSAHLSDLNNEIELPVRRRGNKWTATFEDEKAAGDACFWLRLAIAGQPGTSWKLMVRQRGGDSALLLSDADELALPKEWIVATCSRSVERPRLAVVA